MTSRLPAAALLAAGCVLYEEPEPPIVSGEGGWCESDRNCEDGLYCLAPQCTRPCTASTECRQGLRCDAAHRCSPPDCSRSAITGCNPCEARTDTPVEFLLSGRQFLAPVSVGYRDPDRGRFAFNATLLSDTLIRAWSPRVPAQLSGRSGRLEVTAGCWMAGPLWTWTGGDDTPLGVRGVFPARDETGVPATTRIVVVFDAPLLAASVVPQAIAVTGVHGTATASDATVWWVPADSLTPATRHEVRIAGEAALHHLQKAANGRGLAEDYVWSFTTAP